MKVCVFVNYEFLLKVKIKNSQRPDPQAVCEAVVFVSYMSNPSKKTQLSLLLY